MKKLIPILLLLALLLTACSQSGESTAETAADSSAAAEIPSDHTVITFNGTEVSIRGGGARDTGSAVVISAAGAYEVTGVSSVEMPTSCALSQDVLMTSIRVELEL